MMIFAAPLELAHVSHSPQAAFGPVGMSAAQQRRPAEVQGQKWEKVTPDRQNIKNTFFFLTAGE